jgi:flagellar basal-body rod modification protein FlgD
MSVINSVNASTSTGTQIERKDGKGTGKSDFLRLLTEQLRHQDPLNPMEDRDMMAQLAQFSALEETQAMRQALDRLAGANQMAQAAGLLGKIVTGSLASGQDAQGNVVPGRVVSGVVTGVSLRDGQALLQIGADQLPFANASSVKAGG